jgi:signal transduction histidine kinase
MEETPRSPAQLERELAFYRSEVDQLGARMLRLQEEQSRAAREARRSKIVARLVRDAYQIVHQDIDASQIGGLILTLVADTAFCDHAMFLRKDEAFPDRLIVEHAHVGETDAMVELSMPPEFLFTATGYEAEPAADIFTCLIGLPFILWAYDAESGRGLLLGKQIESNIHRPYDARDREIVEVTLTVYIDVLLRKNAEAELRFAKKAAEDASNARSRFLANLSHELRSPLNTIIGFSSFLLDRGARAPTPDQREEFTRQIQSAGRSLLSLANDILDFSSLGHARLQLRRDWVPVNQLLTGVLRALAADISARDIQVKMQVIAPELQANIDYDRFRQILANLIGNAVKFTRCGGRIDIGADLLAEGGLEILIRDNGIGIRREDLSRVLEPFVQAEQGPETLPRGAGLGLPIAKQLLEAHDGMLRIESTYGEGTTVTLDLPRGNARLTRSEGPSGIAIPPNKATPEAQRHSRAGTS